MAQLGNIFTFIQYGTYDICPGPVFWCKFNGDVRFVIRLTIFGNFFVLHVCICPGPVFQCEFNGSVHFVIRLTIFGNFFVLYVCMYMHYTPLFGANSVVTVIWSSPDIIFQCEFSHDCDHVIWRLYLKKYDMVITRHHFSMQIQLWQWLCHLKTTLSLGKHKVQQSW